MIKRAVRKDKIFKKVLLCCKKIWKNFYTSNCIQVSKILFIHTNFLRNLFELEQKLLKYLESSKNFYLIFYCLFKRVINCKAKHATFFKLQKSGMKAAEIIHTTRFKKSTVYDLIKCFKETHYVATTIENVVTKFAGILKDRCKRWLNKLELMKNIVK